MIPITRDLSAEAVVIGDPEKKGGNPFKLDESPIHEDGLSRCPL